MKLQAFQERQIKKINCMQINLMKTFPVTNLQKSPQIFWVHEHQ
jgi:hypothetical protein